MATLGERRISELQRRLLAEFDAEPGADPRVVAARVGCSASAAYGARKLHTQLREAEAAKEGTLAAFLDPVVDAVLAQHARLHVDDLLVALAFLRCVLAPRVHVGPAAEAPAVQEAVRVHRHQQRAEPSAEWVAERSAELAKPEAGRARVESALGARGYRINLAAWPELAVFAAALAEPTEVGEFYAKLGATSPLAAAKAALAEALPARDYPSDTGLFDPRGEDAPLPDAPEGEDAEPATAAAPPDPELLALAALPDEAQEILRNLTKRERAELEHLKP